MQIPDPSLFSEFTAWASAVNLVTAYYTAVTQPDEHWQKWGCSFFAEPHLGALNPPNPYDYVDWRDYGLALANSLGNASGAPGKVL